MAAGHRCRSSPSRRRSVLSAEPGHRGQRPAAW